jgi:release factor-specific protein-(glutamine-N5) methyltransferase/tRNA threonylcarbamoyl adenosine modification protein (Sua5/YciO/YrdC/YwlC family)
VDAEFLLAHVLGTTRSGLALVDEVGDVPEYWALIARREAREPLAYVLGEWGFRGLTLKVDRRVLVPRPETEVVVERCLALLDGPAAVVDVGVGSGAIALAIAAEHAGARVTGIDRSPAALEVARENAASLGIEVELLERDAAWIGEREWDLVVANPPYVDAAEVAALEPEVREWEPREALVGPGTTELIARAALRGLRPGGHLVLEVADARADEARALLEAFAYQDVVVTDDLAGRPRVVEGRRLGASVADVVAALHAGEPVVLPTDTVYGLCSEPTEAAVARLYEAKGRRPEQPTALLGRDVDALVALVPELRGRTEALLRAVLPGAFTIVARNPARRLPWLAGDHPETIGVRVPAGPEALMRVLTEVPAVAATSANRPGGRDPSRPQDVPLRDVPLLDAGDLPGVPSTVVDVTSAEPRILREGAVPAEQAIGRIRAGRPPA